MIIETPCTTNSMAFTFNQTMDCKNSLPKCLMGVNLRVIKSESPIVHAHGTSLLATQCWNLFIWLNINLPPLEKLPIFHLLSFFDFISISIPSSSSFCFTSAFCISFPSGESVYASSLFIPFILPKIDSLVDLLIFYTLGVTWEECEKRKCKGEMGVRISHLY
jgi:hypothetical protein